MARKKVKLESNIKTLDDANEALRRIGELEAGIDAVVGKYNAAEARRRKAVDEKVNPLREEIKRLERELKLYAQAHKEEFGKKRSVKLPNGSIGFRIGQYAVKALKRLKANQVLALVQESSFAKRFVRKKPYLDKEQIIADYKIGRISNKDLEPLGIKVVQDEAFWYEVNTAAQTTEG